MDLSKKFEHYKAYVNEALKQFPVDISKINSIAVFKALSELLQLEKTETHASGYQVVTREALQAHIDTCYPAPNLSKRQEVNKYLSQRFRHASSPEPDFIEFTFEGDDSLYIRTDEVTAGSKKLAYRICDFDKQEELFEFLRSIDLTCYFIEPEQLNLSTIINRYLEQTWNVSNNQRWYESYQKTETELNSAVTISVEQLEKLWCRQSNGVALIMQGVTSGNDYKSATQSLAKITDTIRDTQNPSRYQQCLELMDEAKERGELSRRYFAVLNRAAIAFDSVGLSFPVGNDDMLLFVKFMNQCFGLSIETKGKSWFEMSSELKRSILKHCPEGADPLKVNIIIRRIEENKELLANLLGNTLFTDSEETQHNTETDEMENRMFSPLNQILYGPPGTGKTYHTIEAAVKAAEPGIYAELVANNLDKEQCRLALKSEYDRLVADKRIRFVTFHQSYGYEEFVEGISANVDSDNGISYEIKSGIFKQICDSARLPSQVENMGIKPDGRVWKISIEGTYKNARKTHCLNNDLAAIGWDDTGDLSQSEYNDYFKSLGKNNQNSLIYFSQEMEKGDLVLCIDSNTSVEAVGVVTGDYKYVEGGVNGNGYAHQVPVKWLKKDFSVDFQSLNGNKRFSLPTCYPLSRLSVAETMNHLIQHEIDIRDEANCFQRADNYVLVIDEINRGNISKIFGELITLIEPSKRQGQSEALELVLPHSGKSFSVPSNLHIIGTMNTADRSLAMMDTALRRRFDFVEMMPKPELLKGTEVSGIDVEKLLCVLNQRIEILYDREHTLGHAFFMEIKNYNDAGNKEAAFAALKSVFQNKVIPLLEEYFFEDWSKIRLVLADNQKQKTPSLQFVSELEQTSNALSDLFGSNHGLEQYGQSVIQYILADKSSAVWDNPKAYIGIYQRIVEHEEKHDHEQKSLESRVGPVAELQE